MKWWIIEPRDTALFRDSRPFVGSSGAFSLPAPWPSTVAGLMRTYSAINEQGHWIGDPNQVRQIGITGPWLVQLDEQGQIQEQFFPAPLDAVFFEKEGDPSQKILRPLSPRSPTPGEFISDSPQRGGQQLLALGFPPAPQHAGKPVSGPAWWRLAEYQTWLQAPPIEQELSQEELRQKGLPPLPAEERTHVALQAGTRTAEEGSLFSTRMRRFVHWERPAAEPHHLQGANTSPQRLALVVGLASEHNIRAGLVSLGGERRLSHLRSATQKPTGLTPVVPPAGCKRLRAILVTPGLFRDGWSPQDQHWNGGRLVAAKVPRPEVISGWDLEKRGPKAARRMVPAGAVYWVEFETAEQAQKFAQEKHLSSVSDDEQDRKDGFGLIVVGAGQ